MAGTAGKFGNFNGCYKLFGPFQFIFISQPKMTKRIPIYNLPICFLVISTVYGQFTLLNNQLQASIRQCMCARQAVDTGIINILVLRKVYFYRISNMTLNKTFVMEFQHIGGEPLLNIEIIIKHRLYHTWQVVFCKNLADFIKSSRFHVKSS